MSDFIVLVIFPIAICRLLWTVRSYNDFVFIAVWVFTPAGKDSSDLVVDVYLVEGQYNSVTSRSATLTFEKKEFWASLAYNWQAVMAYKIGRGQARMPRHAIYCNPVCCLVARPRYSGRQGFPA
jgi:hypothetical protein